MSSLKERGRVKRGFTGFLPVFRAFEGMPDWPAGLLLSLGPWSALFPAAADPGERPVRVKDRAQPGRRSRRRQASLTLRAAIR